MGARGLSTYPNRTGWAAMIGFGLGFGATFFGRTSMLPPGATSAGRTFTVLIANVAALLTLSNAIRPPAGGGGVSAGTLTFRRESLEPALKVETTLSSNATRAA